MAECAGENDEGSSIEDRDRGREKSRLGVDSVGAEIDRCSWVA